MDARLFAVGADHGLVSTDSNHGDGRLQASSQDQQRMRAAAFARSPTRGPPGDLSAVDDVIELPMKEI
ncbi:MAG: hypothetical protein AAF585_10440 [Verrucomicrobiota bacterium]